MNSTNLALKYGFITNNYLEKILRSESKDTDINVLDFSISEALGKGENFSSDILRVKVNFIDGSKGQRSQVYIFKVAIEADGLADMLEEYDVFHREIVFYSSLQPQMQKLLHNVNCKVKLAPRSYEIGISSPKHFVFEDLALDGYRSADRRLGLSYRQLELVLEKVAAFHATTAVLYCQDKEIMKHHHYRNINEDVHHFYALFRNSMVVCAEMAETWPSTRSTIVQKLYNLEHTVIEKACQVYTLNESRFNVLNHGDLWVNNIMYRHDSTTSGMPVEAMLVDFANSYFGSPGIDLSFLLFTSSAHDVTTEQFDLLLQFYHSKLTEHLKNLGYPRRLPSLQDIHEEVLRKGFIGVMYSTFLIPLRLIEDTVQADLTNLLGSSEEALDFRRNLFKHPKYQERMEYLLKYFDRQGFLD